MAAGQAPSRALSADGLVSFLRHLRHGLEVHRDEIDALNVFPVPDGDTGTNLLLSVRSTIEALEAEGDGALTDRLTRGALRGARGNSGVILSQVLRALAETIAARGPLDAEGVAAGLGRARDLAYEAVARPVEGTMLTVIAAAADSASEAAPTADDLTDVTAAIVSDVHRSVIATQQQLDVLREAGVVDAGARGFEVLCEALHRVAGGEPVPAAEQRPEVSGPPRTPRRTGGVGVRESGSLEFRFEVQYLLDAPDDAAATLRESLTELGDSVVVVGGGGLLNVHVHTNEVGAAIEAGLGYGRPSRIEVTYFPDQVAAASADPAAAEGSETERPSVGAVAVVPGPGLADLVTELGAVAVEGGAGALPSVADLLNAVGRVDAERVLLLPGHPNVVPAADQAAAVSRAEGGRQLDVVVTATAAPGVLAALAVLDPTEDPNAALARLGEAAASCRCGEVVAAVRDADTPLGAVRAGQLLGVAAGEVVAVDDDPVDVLRVVVAACARDGVELVTLIVGAGVGADERGRAVAAARDAAGAGEVEVVDGEQRPARYIVGVE